MVTLEDSSRNVHAQVAQRASKQSHLGFGLGLGHGFGLGLGLGLRLGLGLGLGFRPPEKSDDDEWLAAELVRGGAHG